jgi:quinolinate synthase
MQNRDKVVEPLSKSVCLNMSKNRRRELLDVLLAIRGGDYSSQVMLSPEVVKDAKKAIRRMLEHK